MAHDQPGRLAPDRRRVAGVGRPPAGGSRSLLPAGRRPAVTQSESAATDPDTAESVPDRDVDRRRPAAASMAARVGAVASLVVVAALTVLVRLPLLGVPLDPDEGGYAFIARHWAAGAPLYSQGAWVDRPPGLMLVFRWVTAVSYTPLALRLAAAAVAAVLAVGAACCASALSGRRAGLVAGLLAGVVLSGPFIEGYELNGELLASAAGTWGVVAAVRWQAGRVGSGSLVLAGALAGGALMMKQSAFDGLVAVLAVAIARAVGSRRARPVALVIGGALMPLGVAAAWAASTGWSRAWFAVAGFQADLAAGQPLGDRVSAVAESLRHVTPDLLGLAMASLVAAALLVQGRRWLWPAPVWALAAVLAVVSSPFGHPHYWVQAVVPLCVVSASAVPHLGRMPTGHRRVATAVLVLALLAPLGSQAVVLAHSPTARAILLTGDRRLASDGDISAWLRAHARPGEKIYAFVGAAELYLLAGRDTGYPYLWYEAVQRVPGALTLLEQWLSSDAGPRYVVVYQSPKVVDPKGPLTRTLRLLYVRATTIDGYDILERRGPATGSSTSTAR